MDTTGNAVSQSSSANDVYFAVMGPTGAGKSSFIHECSGLDVMIDSSLESGTSDSTETITKSLLTLERHQGGQRLHFHLEQQTSAFD